MDIYRAGPTPLHSVAVEYLLAQAEYSPSKARVDEVIDLIEKTNHAKVRHGMSKACYVLHIPGGRNPVAMSRQAAKSQHRCLMGLASQYGLGELKGASVDMRLYTYHYESGDISVFGEQVVEVRSRTHFVPGDVVREAGRAGKFRGRIMTNGGLEFYHFRRGLVEVRDPDRSPDIPAEVRKNPDWAGRTLVVTIGDTTKRVFVMRYQPGCRHEEM